MPSYRLTRLMNLMTRASLFSRKIITKSVVLSGSKRSLPTLLINIISTARDKHWESLRKKEMIAL